VNRNLGLLLSGQLVSQIGDKFHMLAVAFLVLKTTGSPAKMGLVLFCSVFPGMILGFISGAFLDRYSRKAIIVGADAARGLIVAAVGALYYLDALSFSALLAAQLLISVCTAFFDPAVPAIIPQIVRREQLPRANSQTQFVSGISTIVGPVLGGLTVAWAGYLPVFVLNAGSYLFSAGFESFIRLPPLERSAIRDTKIVDDIIDGCRYVYRSKSLVIILVMVGVIHFFVGSIEAVIPVLATDLKGGGAQNIGFIQTCFGIGTVLAALFISIRNIKHNEALILFGSVFLIGLSLLLIGGIHISGIRMLMPYLMIFPVVGGLIIFAGTSFRSMIQKEVQDKMMGRVFGFVSSVGNISIPLAMLIFGSLMEYVSHNIILAASGFILLPTSLIFYNKYLSTLPRMHKRESVKVSCI
jgi:DHA3 family macrolide efflux protein-like MFS transporter